MTQQMDRCNALNIGGSRTLPRISRLWGVLAVIPLFTTGCAAFLWESNASFRDHKTQSRDSGPSGRTASGAGTASGNSQLLLEQDPVTGDIIVPSVSQTGASSRPPRPALDDAPLSVTPSSDQLSPQSGRDLAASTLNPLLPAPPPEPARPSGPGQPGSDFAGTTHSVINAPSRQTYFSDAQPAQPAPAGISDIAPEGEAHNAGDSWALHLASYKNLGNARAGWQQFRDDILLSPDIGPVISTVELPARGTFYRLKIGPFSSRAEASAACEALKQRGRYCVTMPFAGTSL